MTYEFKIAKFDDNEFSYNYKINKDYSFYHNNDEHFNIYSSEKDRLICYGYCFDVRNPAQETTATLEKLISNQSFFDTLPYLNGQYIMLYIRNDEIHITSDATSLSPIFINENQNIITNYKKNEGFKFFNPNLVLNLNNNDLWRIKFNSSDEDKIESIIELIESQYKYFYSKNLTLNFKSNNYMKALLAIMKPVLYGNKILLNDKENSEENNEFIKLIAKDFNMKIDNENVVSSSESIYFIRNLLFDYKHFITKKLDIQNESMNVLLDTKFHKLNDKFKNAEISMITRKRNQSISLNKKGMLYDPFNAHAIFQLLIDNNGVNIIDRVINELLPSINYYNFSRKTTVKDINNELSEEIKDLKNKQITSNNEQFLLETKLSYFNVSENLDGKIKKEEIIIHPVSQNINDKEEFSISYENPGDGMILVQSFYNNKKNGQSIRVTVGDREFSIDELYEGILFNVKSKLNISMHYKKSRNSLPWQKAGTILIRQK